MATEQIKLTSTAPTGSTSTKSVTYVDPAASNEQLKTFGQKLNALTNNTYGKTDRVITINCDTEAGGGTQTATITLSTTSVDLATLKTRLKDSYRVYDFTATYDGDGQLYAFVQPTAGNTNYLGVTAPTNNSGTYSFFLTSSNDTGVDILIAPITIKVRADATDNFKAAEATFTVTA